MILTYPNERILRSFAVFHYLKTSQVTRLFYSPGSARYVSALLKSLTENRYLTRQAVPSRIRAGSVPYVYALAQRGRTYLITSGYDFLRRASVSRDVLSSHYFLSHSLAITDILIAAALLPKYNTRISLGDIRHDLTLKRLLHGFVVPDGFLDIRIRDSLQQCFFLEVDRGTESKRQIQEKIVGLLRFVQPGALHEPSAYERLFETTSLTILYAIVGQPDKRLTNMMHWTHQILSSTGNMNEQDLFRFALIPEGQLNPIWLFLSPLWSRLTGTSQVPLLEL